MDAINRGKPTRPVFTAAQVNAADTVGVITPEHRAQRKSMPTHAIDDLPPETPADRDDGIYVDAEPRNGGYRVHVTIADVAAYIQLSNPLSSAARERGFTIYRHPMIDHMFHPNTIDLMSLEHGRERLGITITIDLDKNFQPTHTELSRVITRPDNADYEQAQSRMQSDPQFRLMKKVADGVRENVFGTDNAAWHEISDEHRGAINASEKELAATKLVETYMLLANYAVASLFNDCKLPFIYRNFDDSHTSDDNINRAYYSTSLTEHTAIARMGLKGAYAHVTSPIRRGADYFNAHMQHYVMDVIEAAEQGLRPLFPEGSETLHERLWTHAPDLLQPLGSEDLPAAIRQSRIKTAIQSVIGREDLALGHQERSAINDLTAQLAAMKPPFSHHELESTAQRINELGLHERELARSPEVRLQIKNIEREQKLGNLSDSFVAMKGRDDFTHLLRHAAYTGKLPDPLLHEALERIERRHLNLAQDAVSVLVIAQHASDDHWLQLKRAMISQIKHDPGSIQGVLDIATNEGLLSDLSTASVILPVEHQTGHTREETVEAALVAMDSGDGLVSAPYYSIGADGRAASSHAKYSFLEHLAFGQLRPIEQSAIPSLLYADLEQKDRPKEEIFGNILAEIGASHRFSRNPYAPYELQLHVEGGSLLEPITASADGDDEASKEQVIRRVLRSSAFRSATSILPAPDIHQSVHPRQELERRAAKQGWELEIETVPVKVGARTLFQATVSLWGKGGVATFEGEGRPNMHRAINHACVLALEAYHWRKPEQEAARPGSWELEIERDRSFENGAGHHL